MTITAITCACHRPEAFTLCEKYMAAQTRKPDQWLVLDDDDPKTLCTAGQEYYHWPEMKGRGSMARKLRRALETGLVKGDIIVIFENDDWYAPDYIAWCERELTRFQLIGEGRNLYYNVAYRWWFDHGNVSHASLCATALRREVFPLLLRVCSGDDPFVDSQLWAKFTGPKRVFDPVRLGRRLSVGIKAMPGLRGYGSGHDKDSGWAIRDPQMVKLRALLGGDAEAYEGFCLAKEPKRIAQPSDMPTVEVHLVCYNEEFILPYALRHYKTFASRIVVHDGMSTDRSRAICEEAGVEVEDWDTNHQINDELLRILKETCWSGTDAKWVVMADADEFVYFPHGAAKTLDLYDRMGIPIIKTKGFEMESPVLPTTTGQLYEEVNHGSPDDRWYGKPCLFAPARIQSIHFAHGAHEAIVTLKNGRRIDNRRITQGGAHETYLLHYHHLGSVERIGERYDGNRSRFSEANKKNGWGWNGDGLTHAKQKRAAILSRRMKIL